MILFLMSIGCLSYILRIFEINYALFPLTETHELKDGSFFNNFYLIVITMTTVGYGDYSPKTYQGKFIIMCTAIWGAFMISLILLTVSSIFQLSQN